MTIRNSDAPQWLSGHAKDNSWPAVAKFSRCSRNWGSQQAVGSAFGNMVIVFVIFHLWGTLCQCSGLCLVFYFTCRMATVLQILSTYVHGPCRRRHLQLRSHIYIYALCRRRAWIRVLYGASYRKLFCLRDVHAGSRWSLGMLCTLNKRRTSSTLSLYHGATVMMEVVALHIPLNQSLACCALGR